MKKKAYKAIPNWVYKEAARRTSNRTKRKVSFKKNLSGAHLLESDSEIMQKLRDSLRADYANRLREGGLSLAIDVADIGKTEAQKDLSQTIGEASSRRDYTRAYFTFKYYEYLLIHLYLKSTARDKNNALKQIVLTLFHHLDEVDPNAGFRNIYEYNKDEPGLNQRRFQYHLNEIIYDIELFNSKFKNHSDYHKWRDKIIKKVQEYIEETNRIQTNVSPDIYNKQTYGYLPVWLNSEYNSLLDELGPVGTESSIELEAMQVVNKEKELTKIQWLGTQKQLAELFIELKKKGWIEEHPAEVIQSCFTKSNSISQCFKPGIDKNRGYEPTYPGIYTPEYNPKFFGIKSIHNT